MAATEGLLLDTVSLLFSEAERYGDMTILDEVRDSHFALTKRTIEGLQYALDNFRFKYVMKCDDDTFVDLPRVASELQRRQYHARFYWGYMMGFNHVHTYGRYKETQWSLCDRYLSYAAGGGYIISRDLAEILVENRAYLNQYVCEDVSIGAWLSPYNIERRHDTRFNTEALSRGCKSIFLVSHKVSINEMFQLYEDLLKEGVFCVPGMQWSNNNGFLYNWTNNPAHCCRRKLGIP